MKDIVIQNIHKSYAQVKALENISFEVEQGELFGLIGPDGAGKTSLFRILTTLLLPDQGSAQVHGLDCVKDFKSIRKTVGYMPGKFSLYQDLSVEENLSFFATLFETTIKENFSLIKEIYEQLEPFKNRRAAKLSGGMKQKLALCCALIHRPTVLFLDEPTTGVDSVSRKEFWEMLKRLKNEGITILVSTPYMDEANLCERIGLIQSGNMMRIDTPEKIIQDYPDELFAIRANNMGKLLMHLSKIPSLKSSNAFGDFHHIRFKEQKTNNREEILDELKQLGHEEMELKKVKPTIEDCFIELMGK